MGAQFAGWKHPNFSLFFAIMNNKLDSSSCKPVRCYHKNSNYNLVYPVAYFTQPEQIYVIISLQQDMGVQRCKGFILAS